MPKPMLGPDETPAADPNRAASTPPEPPTGRPESPLASQLPSWDLVPPHTLLVRRRPVRG